MNELVERIVIARDKKFDALTTWLSNTVLFKGGIPSPQYSAFPRIHPNVCVENHLVNFPLLNLDQIIDKDFWCN